MSIAEFAPAETAQNAPAVAKPQLPPGVITEGPLVQAKLRESYLLLGILYVGAVAGIIWAITQGVGKVELFTFAWMFALTTFGIGAGMHRLFVHRSFRTGPIMRVFFCAIAQMAVQGSIAKWVANHRRHHLYADDVGDPHSPQFDGFGNRYGSASKGFWHAQGSWVFDQATPTTNTTPRTSSLIRSRCSSCARAGSGTGCPLSSFPP